MNESNAAMVNLQADIIFAEIKVLQVAVWACETNNLPEIARQLRLTLEILRHSAEVLKTEADIMAANV
jgi:hypothetical protein